MTIIYAKKTSSKFIHSEAASKLEKNAFLKDSKFRNKNKIHSNFLTLFKCL